MADTETVETTEKTTPAPAIEDAGASLKKHQTWESMLAPEAKAEEVEAEPTEEAEAEETPAEETDSEFASSADLEKLNTVPKEGEPVLVKLRARNGDEQEIEVADESIAEILRANAKDGMRGEEYRKKMELVEGHLAERRAFNQALESHPESLILEHLPEANQLALTATLLAKHWDKLVPKIVELDQDPALRAKEATDAANRSRDSQPSLEQITQRERYIVQVEAATRALIPEHIDDATAERFMADAGLDIGRAVNSIGRAISPTDISKVLGPRLALYGFDKPASANGNGPSKTAPPRTVARAVGQPTTAPTASTTAKSGADAGAAVRRTVTAQRVAASVPPAGAGAATLRVPMVPAGTTIEQASQALRKLGSWGDSKQ